jgi:hypothetical protein
VIVPTRSSPPDGADSRTRPTESRRRRPAFASASGQRDRPAVTSGAALSALQWAGIDSGRWDEALTAAREASDTATAYKMETVASSADPATATVLAMRGDHEQVRPLLASALASVDAAEYRGYTARARHAGGIAALAAGSYLAAWGQLSQLFGTDGARCTTTSPTWASPTSPRRGPRRASP